jgi:acetylornithine deacetylase/succinyl-diaminopimelate desuccinylase-like protein
MDAKEYLAELVGIQSVFPHENLISSRLQRILSEMGFAVNTVLTGTRKNVVATYGKSDKFLCFYGHMDTVPPNTGMVRPYKLKINGKIGTGLGVADMKGGISSILVAAEYAIQKDYPLKVVFGVDEENIFLGSFDLIKSGLMNNISFMVVGESGEVKAHNQPFNVCYGRKGRILFDATVTGKRAHAARSKEGINAISESATLVRIIDSIKFPKHKNLRETNLVVQGINSSADSFSVPDKCTIQFSLLSTPKVKSSEVISKIMKRASERNIEVMIVPHKRETLYAESYEINRKDPFLRKLERNLFEPQGVLPIYTGSVADENVFANGLNIPVISLGPISGGHHSINEWVDLNSLEATASAYKKVLELFST